MWSFSSVAVGPTFEHWKVELKVPAENNFLSSFGIEKTGVLVIIFLNAAYKDVCLEIQVKYEDSVMEKTDGSPVFCSWSFCIWTELLLKGLQRMDWLHPGPVMQKDLKKVALV